MEQQVGVRADAVGRGILPRLEATAIQQVVGLRKGEREGGAAGSSTARLGCTTFCITLTQNVT